MRWVRRAKGARTPLTLNPTDFAGETHDHFADPARSLATTARRKPHTRI